MKYSEHTIARGDVSLHVLDFGGEGPPLLMLHGLAGSSRELIPTAEALREEFRVVLMDQRGHGGSTRVPSDLSRQAYVDDAIAVLTALAAGSRWMLVGQSMGAHTAFLVAAHRPDLVEHLVMLEGHAEGSDDVRDAAALGEYFRSWPASFADEAHARSFLGDEAIVDAWIADLELTEDGLAPRFDADAMERTIAAVHEPRWEEWERLRVPTSVVFGRDGMFSDAQKDELIRRRPATSRHDLVGGSHDAHLDAFDEWIEVLRARLSADSPPLARRPSPGRQRSGVEPTEGSAP